jgi:hypothetical protein
MTIDVFEHWASSGGSTVEQLSTGQTQDIWCYPGGCIQKGNTVEFWKFVDNGVLQIGDTSPGDDANGVSRFYTINNLVGTLWIPRFVEVGSTYDDGGHFVQFYSKENCEPLSLNSGDAHVRVTVLSYGDRIFNAFGQNLLVENVLEIIANGETHYFGKGLGRLGWTIPGAYSEVVEILPPGARVIPDANIPGCSGLREFCNF